MAGTVVDKFCKRCNRNITSTHKAKACIAEMYLNCVEITEGRTVKNAILLDLFNDFIINYYLCQGHSSEFLRGP